MSEPDTTRTVAEPGAVRRGLEAWLAGRDGLPALLVESARVLASEVDRSPDHSPLWGRWIDLVRTLLAESAADQSEVDRELAALFAGSG